jgi:uncharacterized membrane protein (UPF0127 family)
MKGTAILLVALTCLSCGCGNSDKGAASLDTGLNIRQVTLPDGANIDAEVKITAADMEKGMMYRTSLPADHGMLFIHGAPGNYPYWMANCNFPLDIIWMNSNHQVVEISAKTPPCPSGGSDCPNYGGHETAQFVLELGGGEAARHQIQTGSAIKF